VDDRLLRRADLERDAHRRIAGARAGRLLVEHGARLLERARAGGRAAELGIDDVGEHDLAVTVEPGEREGDIERGGARRRQLRSADDRHDSP
jgi:hypothetical protein